MSARVIALFWLGMLTGVSFLATPVKFSVQDLALPVALQVGQATFALFTRIELVLAAALLAACVLLANPRACLFLALMLGAIILTQVFWLLPALDARVAAIIEGVTLQQSPHHLIYAGLEAAKALLLVGVALLSGRRPIA